MSKRERPDRTKEQVLMMKNLLARRGLSIRQLSQLSGVPYMTVNDICSGKTDLRKCSAENVYLLAEVLRVTSDEMMHDLLEKKNDYQTYKGNLCHELKEMGDYPFVEKAVRQKRVERLIAKGWIIEGYYLLALLDYICRVNKLPRISNYNEFRQFRTPKPLVYPGDVLLQYRQSGDLKVLKDAEDRGIPEFRQYGIIEGGVRDVF